MPFIKLTKHGSIAAMFFLCAIASAQQKFTPFFELKYWNQSNASLGELNDSYWQNNDLGFQDKNVEAWSNQGVSASWLFAPSMQAFIERRSISTLSTNHISLRLASQDSFNLNLLDKDHYHLKAKLKQYQYRAIGINSEYLFGNWSFQFSPKWLKLDAFKELYGFATLLRQNNATQLSGHVDRLTDTSTGFVFSPKPPDLGQGLSLDLLVQHNGPNHRLSIQILNVYSSIKANTAFFANDQYQLLALNNKLTFQNTPSYFGTYGQKSMRLHLPRVIQSDLKFQAQNSSWSHTIGLIFLPDGQIPWAALARSFGSWDLNVNTHALNTLGFGFAISDLYSSGFSAEIGWSKALHGRGQLINLQLTQRF